MLCRNIPDSRLLHGLVAAAACSLPLTTASPARADDRPLVGAIRWDAWQDDQYGCRPIVESTLGPEHWHNRLPFFTDVLSNNQVSFQRANTQAVMDQEIAYAKQAGIDYWAFDTYPLNVGLSNGLSLYLSSTHKSDINFAMNVQGSWLASEDWNQQIQRYVGYFQDNSYQKVMGNRPLVYMFGPEGMVSTQWPNWSAAAGALDQLRQATVNAGLGAPYIVLQTADPTTIQGLNGEALGLYAYGGGSQQGNPYSDLAAATHNAWNYQKSLGKTVVPLVATGWDPRPRVETPNPWSSYYDGSYYAAPTPPELTAHVLDAMNWVAGNPSTATANTVLAYAWNEHDEGGWLCPTLKADGSIDTSRINAVRQAITQFAAQPHIIPLANNSFEYPTSNLGSSWYVVPDAGVDASFGWSASDGSAYARQYLLLNSWAAHFSAAADGEQAMNLPTRLWTSQSPEAARTDTSYSLSFYLCTSQYTVPGDPSTSYFGNPRSRVEAQILAGDVIIADGIFTSPEAWGTWQHYTLEGLTGDLVTGDLTIRFMALDPVPGEYEGFAILDNVTLTRQDVPEPSSLVIGSLGLAGLALRRRHCR